MGNSKLILNLNLKHSSQLNNCNKNNQKLKHY